MAPATRAPRRTVRVLVLLTAVLATIAMTSPAAEARKTTAPATAGRAMWVWTQPAAKTLVDYAKAHGVTDLFLAVPDHLPTSGAPLTWATSVHDLAAPAGIRLQALGGDPGWVDDPAAAVGWETDALSTGLFTGAHVDLEPWQHPQWSTDQAAVVRRYLDTLSQLQAATTLPVEADVAFWLWTITTDDGTPLDTAVLRLVDRVTIMSYRNTATGTDSITDVGATTLARANAAGRPVRLAVETNYLGSDATSAKQTFHGMTQTQLTTALAAVDTAETGVATYAGVAVQDYDGWTALRS
ncbi:MAG: hypothetical protein ACXV4A_16325 [Actinomycetes bacterium]